MAAAMTVSGQLTLPPPTTPAALADALEDRVSCRRFSEQPLTSEHLATMSIAATGSSGVPQWAASSSPTDPCHQRAPVIPFMSSCCGRSVGGIEPGVFYYEPDSILRLVNARPPDDGVSQLFFNQEYVGAAAARHRPRRRVGQDNGPLFRPWLPICLVRSGSRRTEHRPLCHNPRSWLLEHRRLRRLGTGHPVGPLPDRTWHRSMPWR